MNSISKEQATHLDLILQALNNSKRGEIQNLNDINAILLPYKSREYCLSLFYKLANFNPKLLYPENDLDENCFWATDYVSAFLHDGGFTALYDEAAKKQELISENERLALA